MAKIGVIGQGFVGGSLTTVLSERGNTVFVYDKAGVIANGGLSVDLTKANQLYNSKNDLTPIQLFVKSCESDANFSRLYFVCVPTPMWDDGECDISIVESVLDELSKVSGARTAIIKSTVPPGTTEKLNKKFSTSGLRVTFCPEFLTEANALEDMRNQTRIIVGGQRPYVNDVVNMFKSTFPETPVIKTSSTIAEMVKYFTNIQLAARVVLSCEFWQLCNVLNQQGLDIDYDKVVEYARHDPRLGNTHMSVPGHDGIPGARGHCVPGETLVELENGKAISISSLYELFLNKECPSVLSTNAQGTSLNIKRINNVVKNPYKGELIEFELETGVFRCTPEHIIPIMSKGTVCLKRAQDILDSDIVLIAND